MKTGHTSLRLQSIMHDRHLRQVDILNMCEPYCKLYGVRIGRNDISQYVNGKVEPKQDKLSILALALNVTEAWLMGYDDTDEDIKKEDPPSSEPSPVKQQLWNQILQLDDSTAAKLLELCNLYLMQQGKTPDSPGQD